VWVYVKQVTTARRVTDADDDDDDCHTMGDDWIKYNRMDGHTDDTKGCSSR
jgi:hypothetical protein